MSPTGTRTEGIGHKAEETGSDKEKPLALLMAKTVLMAFSWAAVILVLCGIVAFFALGFNDMPNEDSR